MLRTSQEVPFTWGEDARRRPRKQRTSVAAWSTVLSRPMSRQAPMAVHFILQADMSRIAYLRQTRLLGMEERSVATVGRVTTIRRGRLHTNMAFPLSMTASLHRT